MFGIKSPASSATPADPGGVVVDPMTAPAIGAITVVPSDATVLSGVRALYIGGAGDVTATIGGADFVFKAVPVGTILPIQCTKVKAATTATFIVALT